MSFNKKNKSVSCMKGTCSKKEKHISYIIKPYLEHTPKWVVNNGKYISVKYINDEKNRYVMFHSDLLVLVHMPDGSIHASENSRLLRYILYIF